MSTSRSFSQTPRLRQRQNRRWVFFQSPRSGGRSRHGAPVRNIQNTALTNSLLSPAGRPTLPFLPGRCACMFSQTLSEISCRRCAYIASPVMNDMKRCYHIIHSLTTLSKARRLTANAFLRLKRWRGIAARYTKHTASFFAAVHIRRPVSWLQSREYTAQENRPFPLNP